MAGLTRRDFIRISAATAGALAVSYGIAGCSDDDGNNDKDPRPDETTEPARAVEFRHGVASGDPLRDSVMLWTRVTPLDSQEPVTLNWEIARDEAFKKITHNGQMSATAEHDFTAKVDVRNLLPDTTYYYRFRVSGTQSPVGRSRTLPTNTKRVALATVSCSNYPAGYFHAYAAIADMAQERDINAVVHLGDYIYEYGSGEYATQDAEKLGRTLPADNNTELLKLDDYRKRYALYRTDPDLQRLHARLPWIVVWDDHEVANDAWKGGAENHNDKGEDEGDYNERKMQALQAYFEWLPIRPAAPDNDQIIYRSFHFGDLVALHMLDTRIIGRDEQFVDSEYYKYDENDKFVPDVERLSIALSDPSRSLIGQTQQRWLDGAVAQSLSAQWQVLGQQVLMMRLHLPTEIIRQIGFFIAGFSKADEVQATVNELVTLKKRRLAGETLTPAERQRLDLSKPYNYDAWDGYPAARERVLSLFRRFDRYPVVLAGDTHNAWTAQLTMSDGTPAGVEFAVSSVSSPGFEQYLAGLDMQVMEQGMATLADDLRWTNLSQRGFMLVEFDRDQARNQWFFVDSVKQRDYRLLAGPTWRVAADSADLEEVRG